MPAKTGKGGNQLKRKYAAYVGRMTGPRTEEAMTLVLSIGIGYAKEYAPLEYGTLINSAFRRIEKKPFGGFRGIAGFAVNHAVYLNGDATHTPLWKPRPPEDKSGPGWNPFATPRFLDLGFTGPIPKPEIQEAIRNSYKK